MDRQPATTLYKTESNLPVFFMPFLQFEIVKLGIVVFFTLKTIFEYL
jgi:hypothetical protein